MALFLNRELSFIDKTFRKGTEVFPERDTKELDLLRGKFSDVYANRTARDFIPATLGETSKVRWIAKKDIT